MSDDADRLQDLLAAYAAFTQAIAEFPEAKAQELVALFGRIPDFVAHGRAAGATDAQIARGLEEGLHELPELLAGVEPHWRGAVARALHRAVARACPAFAGQQARAVEAIVAAGEIASETQLHLVRYRIAVLEAEPELPQELQPLYALVRAWQG